MKHIGLFEGIGGFSLSAHKFGIETIAWCEWNPFCQLVLKELLQNAKQHNDIKTTDFTIYRGQCYLLTGGFPCQPFSVAGQQRGTSDDRYLWPEMFRAIREIQPRWVIAENVPGLVSWSDGMVFEQVLSDLENEGYEVAPFVLPAASVNAPHKRDRVWIVAYSPNIGRESTWDSRTRWSGFEDGNSNGISSNTNNTRLQTTRAKQQTARIIRSGVQKTTSNASSPRLQGREVIGSIGSIRPDNNEQFKRCFQSAWQNFPTQSPVCIGDDGLPTDALRQRIREDSMGALSEKEIDKIISDAISQHRKESIKAGGNAIVHQVAEQIIKAIIQFENIILTQK